MSGGYGGSRSPSNDHIAPLNEEASAARSPQRHKYEPLTIGGRERSRCGAERSVAIRDLAAGRKALRAEEAIIQGGCVGNWQDDVGAAAACRGSSVVGRVQGGPKPICALSAR